MCGFTGLYLFDQGIGPEDLRARIEAMVATIVHRGPDALSTLLLPFCGVGFRRLSIVDLAGGSQPVANRAGNVHVFLNGEIYNHEELRDRLRREHGLDIRGGSDAAVLPHLYECYGERFVDLLNGMFAIAVIDSRDQSLRLYRDRLGIKPLYLARTAAGLVFGSELKPLWKSGLVTPHIDTAQVVPYLELFYVPGRATLASGVEKLMPGEFVTVQNGSIATKRYWSLAEQRPMRSGEALEELDALLRDATKLQLMADVPIGISLSGGLDSSLIAYYSNAGEANVTAYTITFPDTVASELESSRAVARALRIQHVELQAAPTDFLDDIDRAIVFNDEPVADPAFLPALQVARAASKHVRVLLSGCGADELFAGYGHHQLARRSRLYRLLSWAIGDGLAAKIAGIESFDRRAALRVYGRDRLPYHAFAMTHIDDADRKVLRPLVQRSAIEEMAGAFAEASWMDGRNRQLYVDTVTYLPHQLLSLLDRTTMATAVEGRVPFLDHRVAELAMAIDGRHKFVGNTGNKWLLRKLAARYLPPMIATRQKLGFPNQVGSWFVADRLAAVRERILDRSGFARGFFPRPWLESMLASPATLQQNALKVHSLLVLDAWHRVHTEHHPGREAAHRPVTTKS